MSLVLKESAVWLHIQGERWEIESLADGLRFHPKGYMYAPSYLEFRASNGERGWDGFISPVQILSRVGGHLVAAALRGHKKAIVETCQRLRILFHSEQLISPLNEVTLADVPETNLIQAPFALDEFQRRAIQHWLRSAVGINQMTVGAGKTATFAGAVAMVRKHEPTAKFLYITPTERLVRQSFKELRNFLPDLHITQYGGGDKDPGGRNGVIATLAMLNRNFLHIRGWLRQFRMLLFDECHHASAPSAQKIMKACPAFYRWGASDSIHNDDASARHAMVGILGPVLSKLAAKPHLDTGRLAQPTIYVVDIDSWHNRFKDVPHRPDPQTPAWLLQDDQWVKATYLGPVYELDGKGKIKMVNKKVFRDGRALYEDTPVIAPGWQTLLLNGAEKPIEVESTFCLLERAYDKAIIRFRERNDLIVRWAKYFALDKNWPTLIVCTRTLHVLALEKALHDAGVKEARVRILLGLHDSRERDDAFVWLTKPGVAARILVSPLVKEGVNLPDLQAGVVADYTADAEVANQIIGRFMRRKKLLNEAHITWFYDRQVPSFRQGCNAVLNGLKRLEGYQFVHPVEGPPTE